MKNNFNLVVDNWIKVFDNGTKEVGLSEFFKHAHEFEILAGDSRQQDLSTLRFLLAIVQRVYKDKKYLLSHDLKLIREDTPTTILEAISIFEKTITKICN